MTATLAEIKGLFGDLQTEWNREFKALMDRSEAEAKLHGEATAETKRLIEDSNKRMDDLEAKINRAVTERENQTSLDEFSLVKAIKGVRFGDWTDAELEKKALTAGVDADGGFLIKPEYAAGILGIIRSKTIFDKLGTTKYTGLTTNKFIINTLLTGATGYMIGEGSDINASQQSFGQISLSPKKGAAMVPISNDLIRRADASVNQIVNNDIAEVIALLRDSQFLSGSGTGANVQGILTAAGTNSVTNGTNGGTPTVDKLFDMLYEIEKNGGQATGFAFHPRTKHTLRKIKDNDGRYILLMPVSQSEPGSLLGLNYVESTQFAINQTVGSSTDCSTVLAGQWSEMITAEWVGIQLEASREASYFNGSTLVSAFNRDETVVRAIHEFDAKLRRPNMFTVMTGVRP